MKLKKGKIRREGGGEGRGVLGGEGGRKKKQFDTGSSCKYNLFITVGWRERQREKNVSPRQTRLGVGVGVFVKRL